MPSEIVKPEDFVQIGANARYCEVKRLKNVVKLKLRTSSQLYTLKVDSVKAEEIIKKLPCEIRES